MANSVPLPLRVLGPQDDEGNEQMQYWPFAMSDLYNWKKQSPRFSDNLLGSVMFTWEDCSQLVQLLFTTGEREF